MVEIREEDSNKVLHQLDAASLQGTVLRALDLRRAALAGQDLSGADLTDADLRGANLRKTNLTGANLKRAKLEGAALDSANLSSSELEDVDLSRVNLSGARLDGAHLRGTQLQGAILATASFNGAHLGHANLRGANLFGADLSGAQLLGADLQGAFYDRSTRWPLSFSPRDQRAILFGPGADLHGLHLENVDLSHADLSRADLAGASLEGVNLEEADLRGASIVGAKLARARLRGARLEGANLTGAELTGADLHGLSFKGVNLTGSNLDGANLDGVDLAGLKSMPESTRWPPGFSPASRGARPTGTPAPPRPAVSYVAPPPPPPVSPLPDWYRPRRSYYRRGSIFWALTLIAVGFIFLYQNFNPAVHPWQIIARFWPILIIFWGLSKLVDYIQVHAHPDIPAPPLFSGGEVVLLVLILILGSIVSKVVLRSSSWGPWWAHNNDDWTSMFMNSYNYTQTLSQSVGAQPHLVLIDHRGDVQVHASDEPTIEAVVKETIRASDESGASRLANQLKFEIVQQAGHYLFQSNLENLPEGGRDVRLDISLRVPKGASTEITAEHGDLVLDGLKADQSLTIQHGDAQVSDVTGLVRITKSSGDTTIHNITGNVELEGRGGDVDVSGVTGTATVNGEFSGDVQLENIAQTLRYISSRTDLTVQRLTGRLDMDRGSLEANGVKGPFDLSTREKDISLDGFAHSVKIVDTNGDIRLAAGVVPAHPIEVESKKGEIELDLPANSSFQIDAVSHHGEVQSDFSGPQLKVTTEGDAPSIIGSYGQGGPSIRLTTAYGTIHLAQGGLRPPAPPRPPSPPAKSENTKYRSVPHHPRRVGPRVARLDM